MPEANRLQLDARQRAMLAEMGVSVWLPPSDDQIASVFIAKKDQSTLANRQKGLKNPAAAAAEPVKSAPRAVPATEPTGAAVHSTVVVSVPAPAAARPSTQQTPGSPAAPARAPSTAVELQPRPSGIETMDWPALADAVAGCRACGLCQGRSQAVLGVGDRQADWMVIGEAPGEEEDRRGEPFVGPSGQLLDNMLKAVGLSRQVGATEAPIADVSAPTGGVYIANVIKCRPPGNRNPQPDEVAQCSAYLARQVALVQPRIILALGRFAVNALLQTDEPLGRLRGRVHDYQGTPVVVSYHPAYLLRSLPEKAKAWADLCLALAQLRQLPQLPPR